MTCHNCTRMSDELIRLRAENARLLSRNVELEAEVVVGIKEIPRGMPICRHCNGPKLTLDHICPVRLEELKRLDNAPDQGV